MTNMLRRFPTTGTAMAMLLFAGPVFAESDTMAAELDAFWAAISASAVEGDFDAMASAYHDDAVLVSMARGKSMPISEALAAWKPGIEKTKRGEQSASVEFRFTSQLSDANTAHQTGIFRYDESLPGSDPSVVYIHFEALLVKLDEWKMTMEYQKDYATEEEWNAAGD